MKKITVLALALALLLAGCGQRDTQEPVGQSRQPAVSSSEMEGEANDQSPEEEPDTEPLEEEPEDKVELQASPQAVQPVENKNPGAENPATMGIPDVAVSYRNLDPEGMLDIFLYNPTDRTYQRHFHRMHTETMQEIVDSLDWDTGVTVPAGVTVGKGLLFTLFDHTKLGFTLVRAADGNYLQIEDKLYPLSNEQYDRINQDIATGEALAGLMPAPQWLVWMNPGRAQSVTVQGNGVTAATTQQWEAQTIAENCRHIGVQAGSTVTYNGQQSVGDGDLCVTITFDSGISYRVIYSGNYLYIESSDRQVGLRYNFLNAGNAGDDFRDLYAFLIDG